MKKIGISAGLFINNKRFNDYKMSCVANNYMNSVMMAGAIPFVLPITNNIEIIEEQLKCLDAIILSGGEDCAPSIYGEETLEKCGCPTYERDEFDILITKKALELKVPVLGICRGAQILNVAAKGTLYQDLSYIGDHVTIKHQQIENQHLATHKILIEPNSFLSELFNKEIWVNSFHHQAVKELAPSFKIIAKSTDGVIEAYESVLNDHFMLGVQWHPEMMTARGNDDMLEFFKKFIERIYEHQLIKITFDGIFV